MDTGQMLTLGLEAARDFFKTVTASADKGYDRDHAFKVEVVKTLSATSEPVQLAGISTLEKVLIAENEAGKVLGAALLQALDTHFKLLIETLKADRMLDRAQEARRMERDAEVSAENARVQTEAIKIQNRQIDLQAKELEQRRREFEANEAREAKRVTDPRR